MTNNMHMFSPVMHKGSRGFCLTREHWRVSPTDRGVPETPKIPQGSRRQTRGNKISPYYNIQVRICIIFFRAA